MTNPTNTQHCENEEPQPNNGEKKRSLQLVCAHTAHQHHRRRRRNRCVHPHTHTYTLTYTPSFELSYSVPSPPPPAAAVRTVTFAYLFTTSINDFFRHSSSRFTTVLEGISFTMLLWPLRYTYTQYAHTLGKRAHLHTCKHNGSFAANNAKDARPN